jgi:hypothetical protein
MIRSIAFAVIVLNGACASTSSDIEPPKVPKPPLQGGIAEFTLSSFDGVTLEGRILLGATIDPLVIDSRLNEWIDVEVRDIRTCDSQERLVYYHVDRHVHTPRPDQIITIQPGHWYGAKRSFLFFGPDLKQPKPECFEGELMVWAEGSRIAAKRSIRVTRTDKPSIPVESSPPAAAPVAPP